MAGTHSIRPFTDPTDLSQHPHIQAATAIQTLLSDIPHSKIKIYTSPFTRALETATIIQASFPTSTLTISDLLVERNFGQFEGTSNTNYLVVWANDEKKIDMLNVESCPSVQERAMAAIILCEEAAAEAGEEWVILIVGHGDTLQVSR